MVNIRRAARSLRLPCRITFSAHPLISRARASFVVVQMGYFTQFDAPSLSKNIDPFSRYSIFTGCIDHLKMAPAASFLRMRRIWLLYSGKRMGAIIIDTYSPRDLNGFLTYSWLSSCLNFAAHLDGAQCDSRNVACSDALLPRRMGTSARDLL